MLFFTSHEKTAGNVRNVSKTFMGLKLLTEVGLQFGTGDTCELGRIKERHGWGLVVGCVTDQAALHYILSIASLRNNRSIVREEKSDEAKDSFYEELEQVFFNISLSTV